MRRILLVEPSYRNKYPPLGLMKISTYHKLKGDYVQFVKGCSPSLCKEQWDRIYVATLFTFYWKTTIDTIRYYIGSVAKPSDIFIGGVMATLLGDEIEAVTDVTVIRGLIDRPGMLDAKDRHVVDALTPDYRMLDDASYEYSLKDAYIGYATRGCPNKCEFCAVSRIEPKFNHYLPLKKQVMAIEEIYGPKQDLILMDNNVFASEKFNDIIKDIIALGFERGAKFNSRLRKVDFNQGTDARLVTPEKMALLAKIALKPLRIAFDNIGMKDTYIKAIKLASENSILNLSNYILYNYQDTPKDFYERLGINVLLNEDLGTKIYSFPMRYVPLNAKDRSYIGKHWNRQILRGIQCILLATRGMVSPRREFFEAAFGRTPAEFLKIALMPEEYIIHRRKHEKNGAADWVGIYESLTNNERKEFLDIISVGKVREESVTKTSPGKLKKLLSHYVDSERLAKMNKRR